MTDGNMAWLLSYPSHAFVEGTIIGLLVLVSWCDKQQHAKVHSKKSFILFGLYLQGILVMVIFKKMLIYNTLLTCFHGRIKWSIGICSKSNLPLYMIIHFRYHEVLVTHQHCIPLYSMNNIIHFRYHEIFFLPLLLYGMGINKLLYSYEFLIMIYKHIMLF